MRVIITQTPHLIAKKYAYRMVNINSPSMTVMVMVFAVALAMVFIP